MLRRRVFFITFYSTIIPQINVTLCNIFLYWNFCG
uniref:Uncharacterized protein n=1 Tax=Myoviridae sp. ctplG2 TaxID=2826700 RepID=A0A8S5LVW0_9CAUD|nr:MAG TPA: hypothetical protein [Myoviridae sp. ctplG2]